MMIFKRRAVHRNHGVGATGLEPAIFCSQSRRASRYATPRPFGSAERSRTSVGHASLPTNPIARGPHYGGLVGLSKPRRITAAQREPSGGLSLRPAPRLS